MTTPFQAAGADKTKATRYAPIWTNRFHTGIWTQRNPLRDAATQYLMEKFYSGSRYESLIDGQNVELTTRLTLARRPGGSLFNSVGLWPRINRFYGFHLFSTTAEIIKVMADTSGIVYDATGPSTQTAIFTKSSGAGSTYFQSVGNTLYMGNGIDQMKWVQSLETWAASTTFTSGQYIVDTNNNLQVAMGAQSASITNVALTSNVATVTFSSKVNLLLFAGMQVTFNGLTGATWLNGQTVTITNVNYNQIVFAFTHGDYAVTTDTGSAACTGGATGGSAPTWATTIGAITTDGSQQWQCKGSSVQQWGIAAPANAPTSINATLPAPFPAWAANTVYSPSLSVVGISGGNPYIQELTTPGITGASEPAWSAVLGVVTFDNTAAWTNRGSAAWVASTGYALNAIVAVSWTYYITIIVHNPCFAGDVKVKTSKGDLRFDEVPSVVEVFNERGDLRTADLLTHEYEGVMHQMPNGDLVTPSHLVKRGSSWLPARELFPAVAGTFKGTVYNLSIRNETDFNERHYVLASGEVVHNSKAQNPDDDTTDTIQVNASGFFQATKAGTSGNGQPAWVDGTGATVPDGTVEWTNIGAQATWTSRVGASTSVSLSQTIIDSNGNKQNIVTPGKSGATAPTWATSLGIQTSDNAATWLNAGQYSGANTGDWIYAYAFKNSVTGTVSTASPLSANVRLAADKLITVQGQGSTDTQVDVIQVYRTLQGGSTLFLLDEIAAPVGTATWTYLDTTADADLNIFIQAQTASSNNPPPNGLIALTYHLSRVWGSVGNTVYYSGGPDTLNGNGSETFAPLDSFVFPSKVTRLLPNPLGLLVFTVSDIYLISGLGTSNSPLFSLPFLKGIGLKSYDALDVNGSVVYMFTSDGQMISLDPNVGISQIGFPIGDKLAAFDPSTTFVTWHVSGSDQALYVSDFLTGWYRMSPTSAPETGLTWSPFAFLGKRTQLPFGFFGMAGCSAVQSIETTPGTRTLIIGSPGTGEDSFGPNGGFIAKRDLTKADDSGSPFSAFATFGSIVLAHPGQMAELGFITLDAIATGSRPTLQVLLDEISGSPITNTSWQRISNVMYINVPNTALIPGVAVGQVVTVSGSEYTFSDKGTHHDTADGTFVITSVSPTQFTYANPGNDVGPITTFADGEGFNGNAGASSFGAFETLTNYVNDPPQLAASQSLFSSRYYFNQTQQPAWCRHLQVKFTWPTESFPNELLSFTMFGAVHQEK